MAAREIDTFVQKFNCLWSAGLDAHLTVEAHAGQAWVSLHLRLGHPPGPLQFIPPKQTRNSPARHRRRARREADRKQKAEEANEENYEETVVSGVVDTEQVSTKSAAKANEAEDASIQESNVEVAERASSDIVKCDQCDSEFRNTRGLKAHKGRIHKSIVQLDGFGEEPDTVEQEYTFESSYGEEDVEYTLVEILSDDIPCKLVSRVKIGNDRSANHLCTVEMSIPGDEWQWPAMNTLQTEVIKNLKLKRSPSCC